MVLCNSYTSNILNRPVVAKNVCRRSRQFGTSAEVSARHFGTGAELSGDFGTLGPKCPGSEVS